MAYVITEACLDVVTGSCSDVCPADCIYDAGRMLVIHAEECIDCGACLPACPVEAIYAPGEVPVELHAYIEVNAAWSGGGIAAVHAALSTHELGR